MTLDSVSKIAELASKFILAPIVGLVLYFWNDHKKSNKEDFKSLDEKVEEAVNSFKNNMENFNIKTNEKHLRIKRDIIKREIKNHETIAKKMHDDKVEIIQEIKENGKSISTLVNRVNEYQRSNDSRMTKVETEIKYIKEAIREV